MFSVLLDLSKHHEEGNAKESRNILIGWFMCVSLGWTGMFYVV